MKLKVSGYIGEKPIQLEIEVEGTLEGIDLEGLRVGVPATNRRDPEITTLIPEEWME